MAITLLELSRAGFQWEPTGMGGHWVSMGDHWNLIGPERWYGVVDRASV